MANTKLPLGLTRYAGKKFEQLHDAGCMCLTASNVPDLFGLGRNGRLALAAHAIGIMAIDVQETNVMKRGKMMQDMVARWYATETRVNTRSVHAWIKHPDMELYASPDVVTEKRELNSGARKHFPGEIKVVAKQIYDEQWDGRPPQKVLLQHQAQLALPGAKTGPVISATLSDFVFELEHWDVDAHEETQQIILSEAYSYLEMLKAGELPPPDLSTSQDQEAVIKLATVTEGLSIDMPDELKYHVRRYQRAGTMEKASKKMRTAAKANLIEALGGAQLGVFSDGQTVKLNVIEYKEQHRKAYSATRINIGQRKAEHD